MLSYLSRSAHLAPALKSTAQAVANGSKNIIPGVYEGVVVELVQPSPKALTAYTMAKRCATGPIRASAGIAGIGAMLVYGGLLLRGRIGSN